MEEDAVSGYTNRVSSSECTSTHRAIDLREKNGDPIERSVTAANEEEVPVSAGTQTS
jgi:hypothetical protein